MHRYLWTVLLVLGCMLLPLFNGSAEAAPQDKTGIVGVRVNDGDDKIRIVVDADNEIKYETSVLSNPQRVVVDVKNAWLAKDVKREIKLDSRFASKFRIAQFNESTVRIVVESTMGRNNYNIFTIDSNSPRLVLDFGNLKEDSDQATIKLPGTLASTLERKPAPKPVPTEVPEGVPHLSRDELSIYQVQDLESDKPAESKPKEKDKEKPKEKEKEKEKPKEPVAKPEPKEQKPKEDNQSVDAQIANLTGLKGKKITIDPGHGGSDSGAIGPSGVMEKDVTLRISMELKKILESEGANVCMTRTTDTEVSPRKAHATDIEELQARCDIANRHKSDIFISIHMDSFTKPTAHGTTGYYYSGGSRASYRLADCIRAALIDQIDTESRGTQTCEFYVVRHTDMPATLIEVAFISNPSEEKLLNSSAGIKKAALGIADGISDYFG